MKPVILLELNEINFNFVQRYIANGKLPNFAKMIDEHGIQTTYSETRYEHLEPWIQWVTAHTGKSFNEHGVFRLGDIVQTSVDQIWEILESQGVKVGAMSPMNAKNRTTRAAFFVPDPWTNTEVTGGILLKKLSRAIAQAVNDNATSKIGPSSVFWLLISMIRYVPLTRFGRYLSLIGLLFQRKKWAKAQILDEFLSDVTVSLLKKTKPDFTSLFLNAGAHIQHHYMFNSEVYDGNEANPLWLVKREDDPVYDVYSQYDLIIGKFNACFPKHRIIIATALHQDPFPYIKYYWRLLNHKNFLNLLNVDFASVEPRMSRDFLINCRSVESALEAERKLTELVANDNIPIFEVDNRGDSIFVILTYPHEITENTSVKSGNQVIDHFLNHVVFVAIKNGEHNGEGFLIDTGAPSSSDPIALKDLPQRIASSFGLNWLKMNDQPFGEPAEHDSPTLNR